MGLEQLLQISTSNICQIEHYEGLAQVAHRIKGVKMFAGNHLTIRDYFDQVLLGNQASRKASLQGIARLSSRKTFHQLLTSLGNQPSNYRGNRPTGWKVVDYLNNPVRVKCLYANRVTAASVEQKDAAANKVPSPPVARCDQNSSAKTIQKPLGRRKSLQTTASSAPAPAQSDLIEGLNIEKNIRIAARKYDLPPELLYGVIKAESNFQVRAVSHAGAQGLMQLMPGTAKELGVDNPFDIEQNIDGGARYLRKMLDKFGGDIKLALAAYNAGPSAVEKYGGQIPPYRETEQYVDKVLRFARQVT